MALTVRVSEEAAIFAKKSMFALFSTSLQDFFAFPCGDGISCFLGLGANLLFHFAVMFNFFKDEPVLFVGNVCVFDSFRD